MDISFDFELKEEIRKKHNDNEHTSKFVLSLFPKSNFNRKTGDKMEYKDQSDLPLEAQLGKMIYDMFVIANQFRCLDILGACKIFCVKSKSWYNHFIQNGGLQNGKKETQPCKCSRYRPYF